MLDAQFPLISRNGEAQLHSSFPSCNLLSLNERASDTFFTWFIDVTNKANFILI